MRVFSTLILSIAITGASVAFAAAPPPVRPFAEAQIAGKWFEIARTPTSMNKGCQGSTATWTPTGRTHKYKVAVACYKGALDGPLKLMKGGVTVLNPPDNNRVRMELMGGLISQEYWIIDRADDYSWLILGTPGGRYVSLMSRDSQMTPVERQAALTRVSELGYDASKLTYPEQQKN
ncbi:MAG: lipocalin family protein [Caulobacterales bacterium]